MIHGLSSHSTGSSASAINYFLDAEFYDKPTSAWKARIPAPEVLSGDPVQIQSLCDCQDFKHRYTSGVLSFTKEETALIESTPGMKEALIDELREFTYAGFRDDDSKQMLVVQHSHLDRMELHYLVPRVSCESGLYFNPFPPRYDDTPGGAKNLFITQNNAFVDHVCEKYGLQNPRDPGVKRELKTPAFETDKSNSNIRKQVVAAINQLIDAGHIESRDDMTKFLKDSGAKITREGENSFSFKFPEMKQAIKLEGAMYGKRSYAEIAARYAESRENFEADRSGAESRYADIVSQRAQQIEERHGKRTDAAEAAKARHPGDEIELRDTISELETKIDDLGDIDRDIDDSAHSYLSQNHDLMNAPGASAGSSGKGDPGEGVADTSVGQVTGNKVLDQMISAFHSWKKAQAKKAASAAMQAMRGLAASKPNSNVLGTIQRYFDSFYENVAVKVTTATGINMIEPNNHNQGKLTPSELRLYRQALRAELRENRAEYRELERQLKAIESVKKRAIEPLKTADKLNQEHRNQGFDFKAGKLKELIEQERKQNKKIRGKGPDDPSW